MAESALLSPPENSAPPAHDTTPERRLRAEWSLLHILAGRNPSRLSELRADDTTFTLRLSATPAATLPSAAGILAEHNIRLVYPRFFPAMPLELYLKQPVFHPNIDPDTGFVCLWDRHRAANTAEHALHKLTAILGWRLMNHDALHLMQPAAAALSEDARIDLAAALSAPPLTGVTHEPITAASPVPHRRRLS